MNLQSRTIKKSVSLAIGSFWIEFASAHGGLSSLGAFNDVGNAVFRTIVLSLIVWVSATYLFFRSKPWKRLGLKIFLYLSIALVCIATNLTLALAGYEFFGPAICLPLGIGGLAMAGLSGIAVKYVRSKS